MRYSPVLFAMPSLCGRAGEPVSATRMAGASVHHHQAQTHLKSTGVNMTSATLYAAPAR